MRITARDIVMARMADFINRHLFDPADEALAKAYGLFMGHDRPAKLFTVIAKRLEGETRQDYLNRTAINRPGIFEERAACGHLCIEYCTEGGQTRFWAPVREEPYDPPCAWVTKGEVNFFGED